MRWINMAGHKPVFDSVDTRFAQPSKSRHDWRQTNFRPGKMINVTWRGKGSITFVAFRASSVHFQRNLSLAKVVKSVKVSVLGFQQMKMLRNVPSRGRGEKKSRYRNGNTVLAVATFRRMKNYIRTYVHAQSLGDKSGANVCLYF